MKVAGCIDKNPYLFYFAEGDALTNWGWEGRRFTVATGLWSLELAKCPAIVLASFSASESAQSALQRLMRTQTLDWRQSSWPCF